MIKLIEMLLGYKLGKFFKIVMEILCVICVFVNLIFIEDLRKVC